VSYNPDMAIDPGAVVFALLVAIVIEFWWRAGSR
jgi:hypothetical protein